MNYLDKMQHIAVLGAGGKMGSGIMLLLAQELADLSHQHPHSPFCLEAIDPSMENLQGLEKYLRSQLQKVAEKKCVALRDIYKDRLDLIENADIIQAYVQDAMRLLRFSSRIESAYDARLIVEAASERAELKIALFSQINTHNEHKPWFFTNTSSIPIHHLDEAANLNGRILGFHFYNPPAIQKLVELIFTDSNGDEIKSFAIQLAKKLGKTRVESNDIAGFIGNGHFMRDVIYAQNLALKLSEKMPIKQAIWTVDTISRDYLMRPMGIFQLIDYVGIDVVRFILNVMDKHQETETLSAPLLDRLFDQGILGGQMSDGKQKEGFFKYEKSCIHAVYNPESKSYESLSDDIAHWESSLGRKPEVLIPWKDLMKRKDRETYVRDAFIQLMDNPEWAALLAVDYAKEMKRIGERLVADGVATQAKDVNQVMLSGFYHAYGPINPYV